ncbi:MAG: inorganic pyrophosphatase [Chloroflexi bacterium]|nr:inorganic pyrophosphatase [Chloroflexota bacterium]MBU1749592.1 inorganic pyrophosphatase [Chloroflexota bacterium]
MSFPQPFYRWRPHPWHGLDVGPNPPRIVHAYIEITPFDLVKYEIDKVTGYIRVDRPQRTSSQPPTLYGFIPRTYCGQHVHQLSPKSERGDGDPLDICVISERPLARAEVILTARVIGGIQAIDGGEADDKIVAVLDNDEFWQDTQDIADLPAILIERLQHYFTTYKMMHGRGSQMVIEQVYDAQYALQVVSAAITDYGETYGG